MVSKIITPHLLTYLIKAVADACNLSKQFCQAINIHRTLK